MVAENTIGQRPRIGKRERLAQFTGHPAVTSALRVLFRGPGIVVITHHRIADRVEHDPDVISASPSQLESQARWVTKNFQTLSGSEIAEVASRRRVLRQPAVAFTFDDAYEDNFAAGRMLMEQFGIAATFFVPTGFIESGVVPPWDRLGYAVQHADGPQLAVGPLDGHGPWRIALRDYGRAISELMTIYAALPAALQASFVTACEEAAGRNAVGAAGRSPFMTWTQIRALREMGHTIGAHTHTHPVLASLAPDEQLREIRLSKQILEEQLRQRIDLFAYPYGKPGRSYSDTTKRLVAECGFSAACSFYGGWNRPEAIDPMDVRRIKVDPATSMPMFRTRVTTRGLLRV
jgi:peptidoglycan/xylan/chitin deacetylase (PgdA/CDA1 family)